MSSTMSALLPVFMVIAVGFALSFFKIPGRDAWAPVEKVVFYVLFPVLLFRIFDTVNFRSLPWQNLSIVIAATFAAGAVLALGLGHIFRGHGNFKTLVQGSILFNAYLAIAVVSTIYGGGKALTLAAFCLVLMIAIGNIMIGAATAGDSGSLFGNVSGAVVDTLRNPLIWGCAAGILVAWMGIKIPRWIDAPLGMLAGAAIPMGLLCFGAALDFSALRGPYLGLAAAALMKLAALPVIAFGMCELLGVRGSTANVVILMSAVPAAWASYAVLQRGDDDTRGLTGILTVQTIAAFFTLPLVITRL